MATKQMGLHSSLNDLIDIQDDEPYNERRRAPAHGGRGQRGDDNFKRGSSPATDGDRKRSDRVPRRGLDDDRDRRGPRGASYKHPADRQSPGLAENQDQFGMSGRRSSRGSDQLSNLRSSNANASNGRPPLKPMINSGGANGASEQSKVSPSSGTLNSTVTGGGEMPATGGSVVPPKSEGDQAGGSALLRSSWVARRTQPGSKLARELKSLLNKLTVEKFDCIAEKIALLAESIQTTDEMQQTVNLVLDKAVTEPEFSEMYADLCQVLSWRSPLLESGGNKGRTAMEVALLNKCQKEFEAMPKSIDPTSVPFNGMSADDVEATISRMKIRILTVCKLIGELYIRKMLGVRILTQVANDLLLSNDKPEEHFIECMCQLMSCAGHSLDSTDRGRSIVDQWEIRLRELKNTGEYVNRIKFLIQNLEDTRKVGWVKKVHKEKAKTLSQIKEDYNSAEILGGSVHTAQHGTVVTLGQRDNLGGNYAKYLSEQEQRFLLTQEGRK